MPSTRNVAMSRPRRVRRMPDIADENSWPPSAMRPRKTNEAGSTIHHPSARMAALAPSSKSGITVEGATKLAATSPATI